MSIESTSILPERTTRLAYVFYIYIHIVWLVGDASRQRTISFVGRKGHDIDDAIIARSASDCCSPSRLLFSHPYVNTQLKSNKKTFENLRQMIIDADRWWSKEWDTKSPFLLLFSLSLSCNSKRLSIAHIHTSIYQYTGNISANIIVMIIASVQQTHTYTQEKQTTHACVHLRTSRHTCLTFFD